MRYLVAILLGLLLMLQYRLWLGEGGVLEVHRLNSVIAEQRADNQLLKRRNEALEAEVKDLKSGLEAIEERARRELGMVKDGEVFYQVVGDE